MKKKKAFSILLIASMSAGILSGCGKPPGSDGTSSDGEGGVINIYSWNDEFRKRVEAVYPEVKEIFREFEGEA